MSYDADYLVFGSGIAGLWFALKAAEYGSVLVVTKREASESNTRYAQGGIASVTAVGDSFEQHVSDTLVAGAGLCDLAAVERAVREGPEQVQALADIGVPFDQSGGGFDLGREGGHSQRRVLHAGDVTGKAIAAVLLDAARSHPNIRFAEETVAIDLITLRRLGAEAPAGDRCIGAYVLDKRSGEVRTMLARNTVLATGGAGKVYLYTTNPDVATGDGIAMAYRAGCTVANLEFVQFHPTCLYQPGSKGFLISEALRGEGGELRNAAGEPFMRGLHEMGALAPRDIVARGIDLEMKRTGADCVYLDMTHLPSDFLVERFPTIHETCMSFGIDMRKQPIPVVPACHYFCGGVEVDLDGGTSMDGLYAIGEVAYTGLHGANRLASNSLLEGLVFGARAVAHAAARIHGVAAYPLPEVPTWNRGRARSPDEAVIVSQNWDEIRRFMWNYVGIVRSTKRLLRARRRIDLLLSEIVEYFWDHDVDNDIIELRNIAMVSKLIIESALRRTESRGLHYTLDFPDLGRGTPLPTRLDRRQLEGSFWLRPVPRAGATAPK